MRIEVLKSGFEIFSNKEKYDSFMKFYFSKGGSSRNNSIKNCSRPLPIFFCSRYNFKSSIL